MYDITDSSYTHVLTHPASRQAVRGMDVITADLEVLWGGTFHHRYDSKGEQRHKKAKNKKKKE